jgi:hypothetical protein
MLSEYEMSDHIAKHGFMPNYLVWHQHGEVQAPAAAESDGRDDEDQMDDMIADIGMENEVGSKDQHPPMGCKISTDSLTPKMKKCTMAPI